MKDLSAGSKRRHRSDSGAPDAKRRGGSSAGDVRSQITRLYSAYSSLHGHHGASSLSSGTVGGALSDEDAAAAFQMLLDASTGACVQWTGFRDKWHRNGLLHGGHLAGCLGM